MEDFKKDFIRNNLDVLPPEERLKGISPDERLRGMSPDERLRGMSPEDLLRVFSLDDLKAFVRREEQRRSRIPGN